MKCRRSQVAEEEKATTGPSRGSRRKGQRFSDNLSPHFILFLKKLAVEGDNEIDHWQHRQENEPISAWRMRMFRVEVFHCPDATRIRDEANSHPPKIFFIVRDHRFLNGSPVSHLRNMSTWAANLSGWSSMMKWNESSMRTNFLFGNAA